MSVRELWEDFAMVFTKMKISPNDVKLILSDLMFTRTYIANKNSCLRVGLEIVLPKYIHHSATLIVLSSKVESVIYTGVYSPLIVFNVDERLLSCGPIESGAADSLYISFLDEEAGYSYTCEQERLYEMWRANWIVRIELLEKKMLDEPTQTLICYRAFITRELPKC